MEVSIEEPVDKRIEAFGVVVEAVLEEEISEDAYISFLLHRGRDSIIEDLLGSQDPSVLLMSFQQLSTRSPKEVASYVVEVLKNGMEAAAKEELRRNLGLYL